MNKKPNVISRKHLNIEREIIFEEVLVKVNFVSKDKVLCFMPWKKELGRNDMRLRLDFTLTFRLNDTNPNWMQTAAMNEACANPFVLFLSMATKKAPQCI